MRNKKLKIHFIGIGGIGVSALARYFLAQGAEVSGSDLVDSQIIEDLRKMGAKIPFSPPLQSGGLAHRVENIAADLDLVVYSAAVEKDNPELIEARQRGIKCQKYAEALGELTEKMYTIAVSGMHGKSTTTAMIGLMMEKAGSDPTVIVGAKVREWGDSNFRLGHSKYLVIEADEHNASFLNYWPKIIVLLNIEEEHLDYYRDLEHILETFKKYVSHLGEDGVLVANQNDENINKIFNFQFSNPNFEIKKYNLKLTSGLNLKIPGQYNLSNANAAMKVAEVLGISKKTAIESLNNFSGAWRRMEHKGEMNGARIYDDYAHHPTEIKATLEGARELLKIHPIPPLQKEGGKLYCVFQPHQYHRTYKLFNQFVNAFGAADQVILLPIYSVAGREKESIKKKVSSEMLAEAINNKMQETRYKKQKNRSKNVIYLETFDKTAEYLRKNLQSGDVCVIMGAGDVYNLTELLFIR